MQKRITVFPAFVFACFQTVASSQSANAFQTPDPVPPSPNAALGKFGETPVGLSTGIPEVNIPIYSIAFASGFELPITLSCHAGANRVDEIAGNVGPDWILDSGGVVT